MPIAWTYSQLQLILLLGLVSLAFTFSTSKPMIEVLVPIIAAHYLVLNSICWIYFLQTAVLLGGEEIFRFTFSPFLPAASFFLGIIAALSVIVAWLSAVRRASGYSRRQRLAFSAFCLTLLIGLVVSLRTPIALQSLIDSFSPMR